MQILYLCAFALVALMAGFGDGILNQWSRLGPASSRFAFCSEFTFPSCPTEALEGEVCFRTLENEIYIEIDTAVKGQGQSSLK